MDKKSKNTLIVSIIALALVLIGVTYAYFSARITGLENASTISLTAGRMGIVFSEGSEDFEASNIYPREEAWITKTFTLTGYNTTDQEMNYYAGFMVINNTFPNTYLTYDLRVLEATSGTPIVEKTGVQINGTGYIRFGKGTFRGANGDHHSYEVKIYFKDNGKDQNDAQEAIFNGKLYVTPGVPQNEYTVYEDVQKLKTYDINYQNCVDYFNNNSNSVVSSYDVADYCQGRKIHTEPPESIANIIAGGDGDELESLGMIQNVVRDGNNEITSYSINYSNCMSNINRDYMFNNADAATICNGGEAYRSYSIEREILSGNYDYLISENIIKNVVRNNNDEITSYDIDYNNCMASYENSYTPEDENESYCTGGDAYATTSLDADIKQSWVLQEYIEQNVIENMTYETVSELKKFNTYDTVEVGQYTYTYDDYSNGWSVALTDIDSTDPVTTKLLTSINGKPIVSMSNMFNYSKATSIDLSSFDTSNVKYMSWMFSYSEMPDLDLSNFDTSNVTDMQNMFNYSKATSIDLSSFDTSKVTNMNYMFSGSKVANLDLSSFDTSNVTDMSGMFSSSAATSIDLSSFDFSSVNNVSNMFNYSNATNIDLTNADLSSVSSESFKNLFSNSKAKTIILKNANLSSITSINKIFDSCSLLETIDFSGADLSAVTNMTGTFSNYYHDDEYYGNRNLSSLKNVIFDNADLSSLDSLSNAFYSTSINDVSFKNVKVPKLTSMNYMFQSSAIKRVDFTNTSFPKLSYIDSIFKSTTSNVLDIVNFDTSNVTVMEGMFQSSSATTINGLEKFNTSNVTNMTFLFMDSNLTSLDLSNFDTSNVTRMVAMFSNIKLATLDLSSFDTSNVTSMSSMFYNSSNLTTIYVSNKFVTTSLSGSYNDHQMFKGCTSLVGGAGTTYDENNYNKLYAHIDGGASNPGYFTAK